MPNHLSNLGIFHTVISVLALIFAFVALAREGKINPKSGAGKAYVILTALTCLTSFGIMKTGHFTPAHSVAVLVLVLLLIGMYAPSLRFLGRAGGTLGLIAMSTTLFFSFIPTIVETLTRLPISHPIAADPNAPVIKTCFLVLIVLFVTLLIFQLRKMSKKPAVSAI